MNIPKSLAIMGISSWCGLGFIRGANSYTYNHNKFGKNQQYLYMYSMSHGFIGVLMYANPLLFPITASKEIYRLEVNLRNLENEKNTDYYNNLWW
jgi:hypothetical protein